MPWQLRATVAHNLLLLLPAWFHFPPLSRTPANTVSEADLQPLAVLSESAHNGSTHRFTRGSGTLRNSCTGFVIGGRKKCRLLLLWYEFLPFSQLAEGSEDGETVWLVRVRVGVAGVSQVGQWWGQGINFTVSGS